MRAQVHIIRRWERKPLPALLPMALALLLTACAAGSTLLPPPGLGTRIIEGVPFFAQQDYQCGPSVLASLLGHLGDALQPEEIGATIFREDMRGTLTLDMGLYPRQRGHESSFGPGSPEALVASIDAGRPAGVMINLGFNVVRRLHFMTVIGYTPDAVVAHSADQRATHIPWSTFLAQWDYAGRWMLTVRPGNTP